MIGWTYIRTHALRTLSIRFDSIPSGRANQPTKQSAAASYGEPRDKVEGKGPTEDYEAVLFVAVALAAACLLFHRARIQVRISRSIQRP
ncbi:unnamed protein product [Anisakis simplex]|uniref:DUF1206 domain-containing protein n=1 Tax=Anisakis simplex TaxID=6269 RepID=A0A0M3K0A8_ANISI|nr:unnamed protein product [Anisakis simplex]